MTGSFGQVIGSDGWVVMRQQVLCVLFRIAVWVAVTTAWPTALLAADADSPNSAQPKPLVVATMEAPPFAMKDASGRWHGITIELWEAVADRLGLPYAYREYDLEKILQALESGEADIGAAGLSVTAERAKRMDFTHTYFGSDLGIATSFQKPGLWMSLVELLFSWSFAKVLLVLLLVLLSAATLVWAFERKQNASQFGGGPLKGLGAAFWWSAVTMTTVGYGDKSPITAAGRLVALVWMFASILIISLITGAFATTMTVHQLTPRVNGPQDLKRVSVGTLRDSVAADFLRGRGIEPRYFETVSEGLQATKDDKVTAFVIDHAILTYVVGSEFPGEIDVLDDRFEPSYLGLAMSFQQPYRRAIDLILLDYIQTPAWDAVVAKYRAAR
jgi:ABC-type amino acid transport substrate-binding protein